MDDLIRQTIYFEKLNTQDYQAILRCFNARHISFKKNEIISKIGDEAKYIYIITSGQAKSQYYDLNGKLNINRTFYTNDIFGINYTNQKDMVFTEELIALEDTTVLRCDAFRFINPCQNRCKRHIDCMILTISNISDMINMQTKRINVMCQTKTRYKIMTYLTNNRNGKKRYIKIPYNQSELAAYLGLERSALSFELNKLKHEGIIDFDDKLYKIKKKI